MKNGTFTALRTGHRLPTSFTHVSGISIPWSRQPTETREATTSVQCFVPLPRCFSTHRFYSHRISYRISARKSLQVSVDIEKVFHQVEIERKDEPILQYLW